MERVERIRAMERILRESEEVLERLEAALDAYEAILPSLRELDAWYGSELWRKDLAADEAGLIPKDLPRGVLSQDEIWDLLEWEREIRERLSRMAEC